MKHSILGAVTMVLLIPGCLCLWLQRHAAWAYSDGIFDERWTAADIGPAGAALHGWPLFEATTVLLLVELTLLVLTAGVLYSTFRRRKV